MEIFIAKTKEPSIKKSAQNHEKLTFFLVRDIFALAQLHFYPCLFGHFPVFLAMTWLQERADIAYKM